MIGKKNRFHGYGSLRFVYSKGQQVRGQHFSLKYALNTRRREYRLAVVVSKKVSKSAVTRNRIRRRIYEIVRQQATPIIEPYDIVITVFSDTIAIIPAEQLTTQVSQQLKQAGIISK